jgi:hypothetical protein
VNLKIYPFVPELNARCDLQKAGAERNFKGLHKKSHNSQLAVVKVQPFEHHSV